SPVRFGRNPGRGAAEEEPPRRARRPAERRRDAEPRHDQVGRAPIWRRPRKALASAGAFVHLNQALRMTRCDMRVATIDIGTNTTLLLVAEVRGDVLVAVEERATITRLGEGVDKTRTLAPAAVARTNACLDTYADAVKRLAVTRVAVVGTSAMRDAGGGE